MRRSPLSTLPRRRTRNERFLGMAVGFFVGAVAAFAVLEVASETGDPTRHAAPEPIASRTPVVVATGRAEAPSGEPAGGAAAPPAPAPVEASPARPMPTGHSIPIADPAAPPAFRHTPGEPVPLLPAGPPNPGPPNPEPPARTAGMASTPPSAANGPREPVLPPLPLSPTYGRQEAAMAPENTPGSRPVPREPAEATTSAASLGPPAGPAPGTRIFIHHSAFRALDRQIALDLAEQLTRQGYSVADVRAVGHAVRSGSVRYFFPHDREGSEAVVEAVRRFFVEQGLGRAPARPSDFSGYERKPRDGTVEVWIPTS